MPSRNHQVSALTLGPSWFCRSLPACRWVGAAGLRPVEYVRGRWQDQNLQQQEQHHPCCSGLATAMFGRRRTVQVRQNKFGKTSSETTVFRTRRTGGESDVGGAATGLRFPIAKSFPRECDNSGSSQGGRRRDLLSTQAHRTSACSQRGCVRSRLETLMSWQHLPVSPGRT